MKRPWWYKARQTLELFQSWWRPMATQVIEGDAPAALRPRTVYIITDEGEPWQACMQCPLGCDHTIQLNLVEGVRPCWSSRVDKGLATLAPSVWRTDACRCHFFVRNGRIVWCD